MAQVYHRVRRLIDWRRIESSTTTDKSIDWLIDWLDWFIDSLDRFIDWLIGWFIKLIIFTILRPSKHSDHDQSSKENNICVFQTKTQCRKRRKKPPNTPSQSDSLTSLPSEFWCASNCPLPLLKMKLSPPILAVQHPCSEIRRNLNQSVRQS